MILIRTHGGLGNQLFQMFFALALSDRVHDNDINVFHDSRYKHGFKLSPIFKHYTGKTNVFTLEIISSLRIPKILTKMRLGSSGYLRLGSLYILDEYFQNTTQYDLFDKKNILSSLERLRILVGIDGYSENRTLYHFRLGDFFSTRRKEEQYISQTINKVINGSDIITSNDSLFRRVVDVDSLMERQINLIETSHLEPIEVLRLMSRYEIVNSNSSTIALWSTILSGAEFISNDPKIDAMKQYLTSYSGKVRSLIG